jgi:D-alanyl-lipoteichoic acid acyltransferase DltB (MBOAT superfamily)
VCNKKLSLQNALLLFASYFFYSCWDWRFLFLLAFSTFLDYYTGIKIFEAKETRNKKRWFWLSVIVNLGFLAIFKYYDFFAVSFQELFHKFGVVLNVWALKLILPVGISFYTFHGLSYVIDVYKGRIEPERNFIAYSVFVSFFPLLVAGPIERATHLLPQIKVARVFEYEKAVSGLKQILWGLFKKVVIADSCAEYANMIFNDPISYNGSTLLIGAVMFAFQIYGDFSGYSDIALGTARLFGIELLRNFSFPYFSRDIAEFWRRWHISLSSWFRDYLYIPLGGSRVSKIKQVRNTFIIFLVSGFWHGANWTFIAWGAINAIYFLPLLLSNKNRSNIEIVAKGKYLPGIKEFIQMLITFLLVTLAWIFFRANSLTAALEYIQHMFSLSLFSKPLVIPFKIFIPFLVFIILEWFGRENQFAVDKMGQKVIRPVRWALYSFIIFLIGMYMHTSGTQFIYFQF